MEVHKIEKLDDGRTYLVGIPEHTCSQAMEVMIDKEGRVEKAKIYGGCMGNTQGICQLVQGMEVKDVVTRLSGIDCGGKGTSCPDQLAKLINVWQEK